MTTKYVTKEQLQQAIDHYNKMLLHYKFDPAERAFVEHQIMLLETRIKRREYQERKYFATFSKKRKSHALNYAGVKA